MERVGGREERERERERERGGLTGGYMHIGVSLSIVNIIKGLSISL